MNLKYISHLNILILILFLVQLTVLIIPHAGIPIIALSLGILVYIGMKRTIVSSIIITCAILLTSQMAAFVMQSNGFIPPAIIMYGVMYLLGLYYWLKVEPHKPTPRPYSFHAVYLPIMAFIGLALGAFAYLLRDHLTLIPGINPVLLILYIPFLALAEELLFSRLIFHEVAKNAGRIIAVVAVLWISIAFEITTDLVTIGFILLSSLVIATIYAIERNLLYTMTVNMVMKLTFVLLMMR